VSHSGLSPGARSRPKKSPRRPQDVRGLLPCGQSERFTENQKNVIINKHNLKILTKIRMVTKKTIKKFMAKYKNLIIVVAVIAAVVGVTIIANTEGDQLQGYMRLGAVRIQTPAQKVKKVTRPVTSEAGPTNVVQPNPNSKYTINLLSPADYSEMNAPRDINFTWSSNVPSGNGYSINFNCSQSGYPNVEIDSIGWMQTSFGLLPIESLGLSGTINTSRFYDFYMAATYKEAAVDTTKPIYCLWNVNSSTKVYMPSKKTWHFKINPAR
jgi:hypothetical protein